METSHAKPLMFNDLYKGPSSKPLLFNDLYKAPSPKPLMFNDLYKAPSPKPLMFNDLYKAPPPRPLLFNDLHLEWSETGCRGSDDPAHRPLHKRVWDEAQHRRNEKGEFTAFLTRVAEAAWSDPTGMTEGLGASAVAARARKDPLNPDDPGAAQLVTRAGILAALLDGQRNGRTNPVNAGTGATQVVDASAAIALGGETALSAITASPLGAGILAALMLLLAPTPVADGTCASGECTVPVENQPSILYNEEDDKRPKKKSISGSGKEKAKDPPSWARGERPYVGESGKEFAQRLMDKRYGEIGHKTGAGSDFGKIQKWGDRDFK